ncbi:flippase-like domain-containing protein [Pseudenhygromyxa sp. WMMC2535]|uniref:lysylphosphatidylglycerol synthase transmembrane domain-containing protein n=1 Tax=Pseudenhygromyxa sp. WMMC2535 TaxID=2712867 RepID=UPI001552781E|nr:lysylphosphatidylglycerol synthase transmembrane domain-containing protein [Pseudenhygromyxa sp. WMMC2535]NVB38009.1 flippase-like domain-containing protein [Pseudenhygromyxa sp. WMMC2535]
MAAARELPREAPSAGRRVLLWLVSVAAAAALLILVARFGKIDLWPERVVLPRPWLLVAACAVQLPYAGFRAARLRFALDRVVARASADASPESPRRRLDWRVLHGSGLVSFPAVILLPFRLGEFTRPLLITRAREPGVGFTESLSAIAVERVVDALIVVAMLFVGLELAHLSVDDPETLSYIRGSGRIMALTFVLALAALIFGALEPAVLERVVGAALPGRLGQRAAAAAHRMAATIAVLFDWRLSGPFLLWSAIYWGLTIFQLWLLMLACGLELGFADAAVVVAVVGLSIQVPGGPAQAGSFQVGMALALGLLTGPSEVDAASTFAALMYLLQLLGACVLALPGALLLGHHRRTSPDEGDRAAQASAAPSDVAVDPQSQP